MTALVDLLREPGWEGVAIACAAYLLLAAAMLPAWPLTLAIGSIYGTWGGLLIASPAGVAAATAVFLLGRSVLRDRAQRRIARSDRLVAISRAISERGSWVVLLLLRLSPIVPFNVLNYALSVTDVPLRVYVAATAVGMLPPTVLYLYLGSLGASIARGRVHSGWQTALSVTGLAATAGAVWLIGRRVKNTLH